MSNIDTLTEKLIDWAATRSDEIVFNPTSGYYSFEIVSDAFEKGKIEGEKLLKERVRAVYFENAKLISYALKELINGLKEKNFFALKLFVKNSFEGGSIVLSIPEEQYLTEEFMTEGYRLASELQSLYHTKKLNLTVSFLRDSDKINLELLKSDGFGYAVDIETDEKLY